MLESWIMDARYSARRLLRRPTYTLLAVMTLALGVGGTAAIHAIVRALLLDPLPYEAEEEVAVFWNPHDWNEQEMLYMRGQYTGFREVAGYRMEDVTLSTGGGPARLVPGVSSSFELFRVLGARPLLGRGFQEGDDAQGVEPVAVLSYGLWRDLGGDASVVGSQLRLDGIARTIVGVMPRGFWFPDPTARVWLAEALDPNNRSGNYALVGRLEPGRSISEMDGPLSRITATLDERYDYPEQWDKTKNAKLTPIRDYTVGFVRPAVLATLAAMALILLMACANVAALMLGQVDGRTTELAVRTALGASRVRLLQQVVAEALIVGALAGTIGAVIAAAGFPVLLRALPLGALAEGASADWRVFATAIAIGVAAALLVAFIPVLTVWRGDLRHALGTARTSGVGARGGRLESGLVVAEVALSVLVAAGAALLIRSVSGLAAIDPGVDVDDVAVVDIAIPSDLQMEERRRVLADLLPVLRAIPGVLSADAAQRIPLRGGGDNWGLAVEGKPDLPTSTTAFRLVSPGYLATMDLKLVKGRGFEESDRAATEPVVVINEALAEKYFPGEEPIGRRISTAGPWERIIGVVENAAEAGLTDERGPARYMLYEHMPAFTHEGHALVLEVDARRDAALVLEDARGALARAAPSVAVQATTTMRQVFAQSMGPVRQVMTLLTLLAGLALVLGAVGVYGVVSHFVLRRKREFGIRIALGQNPRRVVAQVLGRGGVLIVMGIVGGIVAAVAMARLLESMLYGISAADPLALAGAMATLLSAGLIAALIPAYRASRTEPASVLREQ